MGSKRPGEVAPGPEWNAEKRHWAVVLGVVRGLVGFGQGVDSCPSPDLGYCQLIEAGGIELLEPVLASLAAVWQELWRDIVWPLGFPTLQLANISGELFRCEGCCQEAWGLP